LPVSIGDLTVSNTHFTGSTTCRKVKLHFRRQIPKSPIDSLSVIS